MGCASPLNGRGDRRDALVSGGEAAAYDSARHAHHASTLVAAQQLAAADLNPAVLNFASANHPGGGWLSGALAQEKSLARAAGLVPCLVGNPLYARNAVLRDALYTDDASPHPAVPVFRDDAGALLAAPYRCAFITAPALQRSLCHKPWSWVPH